MVWLNGVVLLYALLNIGGGIEGFISKHSLPSVISGVIAGVLLIGGAALAYNMPKVGYGICAFVAVADLGFFGPKLMKTSAVWPAGVMVGASVIVFVCAVVGLINAKPASI